MKDSLVQQCLDILKRDDIKNELKILTNSIFDFIVYQIQPYMYIVLSFVFFMFIMNLAILIILIILLRNKHSVIKNI